MSRAGPPEGEGGRRRAGRGLRSRLPSVAVLPMRRTPVSYSARSPQKQRLSYSEHRAVGLGVLGKPGVRLAASPHERRADAFGKRKNATVRQRGECSAAACTRARTSGLACSSQATPDLAVSASAARLTRPAPGASASSMRTHPRGHGPSAPAWSKLGASRKRPVERHEAVARLEADEAAPGGQDPGSSRRSPSRAPRRRGPPRERGRRTPSSRPPEHPIRGGAGSGRPRSAGCGS